MTPTEPTGDSARPGGVTPIFLKLAPADIALIKFLFESYEGVAVVRTIDRRAAVIVAMVSRDFEEVARAMLDSLRGGVSFDEIPPPPAVSDDWLLRYALSDDERPDSAASAASPSCGAIFQRSQT
jgi:hypothetical protein